jgi:hypothetical protein
MTDLYRLTASQAFVGWAKSPDVLLRKAQCLSDFAHADPNFKAGRVGKIAAMVERAETFQTRFCPPYKGNDNKLKPAK